MKIFRFLFFLLLAVVFFALPSCSTANKDRDYIMATASALEVLVPKYLEYVNADMPAFSDIEPILLKVVAPVDEKDIINELLAYLSRRKTYNNDEKQAINDSYRQLLKTARLAAESNEDNISATDKNGNTDTQPETAPQRE